MACQRPDLATPFLATAGPQQQQQPGEARGSISGSLPNSPFLAGRGTPLRSPFLAGRPKSDSSTSANTVEETWWIDDVPSRQLTASTMASEADCGLPLSPEMQRGRRLQKLKERRGWKHFLRHTVPVPLALVAGLVLGSAATAACLLLFPGREVPAAIPNTAPYAVALPPTEVPAAYLASPPLDNSCLISGLAVPAGPRSFDACAFVIKSTDEVWNARGDVDAAIEKYFHEEYLDAGSWGRRIVGKKALREAILSEMRAFPDIRIHITDCNCQGNDIDGYKCAMPDVLTGTNHGPSAYGPPTGRYARWTGMVESLVKWEPKVGRWQYFAEWGVHDEWSLIQQLGLDFARVPRPAVNNEPLHDCSPLLRFGPSAAMDAPDVAEQKAAARLDALEAKAPTLRGQPVS